MSESFPTPPEYKGVELSDTPDDKFEEFIKLGRATCKIAKSTPVTEGDIVRMSNQSGQSINVRIESINPYSEQDNAVVLKLLGE